MVCVSCSQHIWIATATSILKQSTPKQHFRSENKAHHTATIATFVRPYMETARESVSESGSHWYVRFFFHMPASKACLIAKALVKWNSSHFASLPVSIWKTHGAFIWINACSMVSLFPCSIHTVQYNFRTCATNCCGKAKRYGNVSLPIQCYCF